MRFVRLGAAALGLMTLTINPATARSDTETQGSSTPDATPQKKKGGRTDNSGLICVREPLLGSRTKTIKTCRTREQWNGGKKEASDAVDELTRDR